jgi:hypothetical protein
MLSADNKSTKQEVRGYNHTCTLVGTKGLSDKYTEVFNGKKVGYFYQTNNEHGTKRKHFFDYEDLTIVDENFDIKLHTKDNKVVYVNALYRDGYMQQEFTINIVSIGTFYDSKEYYNCIRNK